MRALLLTVVLSLISILNYAQVNPNSRYQKGYVKKSTGAYVQPHYKTTTNKTNKDNYSTTTNTNLRTGQKGYKAKDYSSGAYNYGKGKIVQTGSKGGQYYYNRKGKKTYVPKRR
jgi:hypothetical protein